MVVMVEAVFLVMGRLCNGAEGGDVIDDKVMVMMVVVVLVITRPG